MTYPFDPSGLPSPVFPKTDLVPLGLVDPTKYVAASDWNALVQAVEDIRAAMNGGAGAILNTAVNAALTPVHRVVNVDASGGNRTITLPAASDGAALPVFFKKTDGSAYTVTITRQGVDTIDGLTTFVLTASVPSCVLAPNNTTTWRVYGSGSGDGSSIAAGVQTTAALRALVSATTPDKQMRLVEDKGAIYRYDVSGTGADDDDFTIKPTDVLITDPGRWFKVQAATQNHENLTGLQGGVVSQHYHLSAAELAQVLASPVLLGTVGDVGQLWVSKLGSDGNAGTVLAPKLTIQAALAATTSSGQWIVWVGPGSYVETLDFTALAGARNIAVVGMVPGQWSESEGGWFRWPCEIRSPSTTAAAVKITAANHKVVLHQLDIETNAQDVGATIQTVAGVSLASATAYTTGAPPANLAVLSKVGAGWTANSLGRSVVLTGFATPANNGSFLIAAVLSADDVLIWTLDTVVPEGAVGTAVEKEATALVSIAAGRLHFNNCRVVAPWASGTQGTNSRYFAYSGSSRFGVAIRATADAKLSAQMLHMRSASFSGSLVTLVDSAFSTTELHADNTYISACASASGAPVFRARSGFIGGVFMTSPFGGSLYAAFSPAVHLENICLITADVFNDGSWPNIGRIEESGYPRFDGVQSGGLNSGMGMWTSPQYLPKSGQELANKQWIDTNFTTITNANYTPTADELRPNRRVLFSTGASTRTFALPPAADMPREIILVKKVDAGAGDILLDPNGGELIDGAATKTLSGQNNAAWLISTGTGWESVVSSSVGGVVGGDLSGTLPNPLVDGIQGVAIPSAPTAQGSQLTYRGSQLVFEDGAPSNQGEVQTIFSVWAPTSQNLTGSYVNVAQGVGTFTAPYAGNFLVLFSVGVVKASGTTGSSNADFRLTFTGPTTTSIGPSASVVNNSFRMNLRSALANNTSEVMTSVGVVALAAGTYTVQLATTQSFNDGDNVMQLSGATQLSLTMAAMGGTAGTHFEAVRDSFHDATYTTSFGAASNPTAYAAMPQSALTSGTFSVPAGGKYVLRVQHSFFSSGTNTLMDYRLKIDGVVVSPSTWRVQGDNNREQLDAVVQVNLAAGQHTFAMEWSRFTATAATAEATTGASDVFRFTVEGGAAVQKVADQIPYRMAWVSNAQVSVAAKVGTLQRVFMNDGAVRQHTGTLTFDFTNGVANLGLDTGVEAANTWYYLYAVPLGVEDFTLRASTTSPTSGSGPSGFTSWKYLGAFRNDASSNILQFYQAGAAYFTYAKAQGGVSLGTALQAFPTNVTMLVPETAVSAIALASLFHDAGTNSNVHGDLYVDYPGVTVSDVFHTVSIPNVGSAPTAEQLSIPTPGSPKRILYRSRSDGTSIFSNQAFGTMGWHDGFIDQPASASFAELPAPTNQGIAQVLFNARPTATRALNSFATVLGGTTDANFVAPYDGTYLFMATVKSYAITPSAGSPAQYGLSFDGAAAETDESWQNYHALSQEYYTASFFHAKYLTKGAHTVALQWKSDDNTSTIRSDVNGGMALAVIIPGGNANIVQNTVFDAVAVGTTDFVDATTWVSIPGLTGTFNAPYSGDYTFLISAVGFYSLGATTAHLRLAVSGATTGNFAGAVWLLSRNTTSERGQWAGSIKLTLNAGVNTIQLQGKLLSGTVTMRWDSISGATCSALGGSAVHRAQDQTPYKITWLANDQVSVAPLQGTSLILHLNDGLVRTQTAPLTLDIGTQLDTGVKAAATWYAVYAVPSGTGLALRASLTFPTTGGPAGFTAYKYLGAIRTDGSSNILKAHQLSNGYFAFDYMIQEQALGAGDKTINNYTLGYAPPTASAVRLHSVMLHVDSTTGNIHGIFVVAKDGVYSPGVVAQNTAVGYNLSVNELQFDYPLPGTAKVVRYQSSTDAGLNKILQQTWAAVGWYDGYIDPSLGVQIAGGGGSLSFKEEGSAIAGSPHTSLDFVGGRVQVTDLGSFAAQTKTARQVPPETVTTQAVTGTNTALSDQLNFVPIASATGAGVLLYFNSALCPSTWYSVSGQVVTWNAAGDAPDMTISDSLVAVYETMG
jgi:hypothetical protein